MAAFWVLLVAVGVGMFLLGATVGALAAEAARSAAEVAKVKRVCRRAMAANARPDRAESEVKG